MSWKIEIKPTAEKQYRKLDKDIRRAVKDALRGLEGAENPLFQPDVRPLTGRLKGDYRMRVGRWRVLFTPDRASGVIHVYAVLPRGSAY